MSKTSPQDAGVASFLRGMGGDADARRVAIRDALRASRPGWANEQFGADLIRALSAPRAKREREMLSLIESVLRRALSGDRQERRSALVDLLFVLSWENWPSGAEWRRRLAQLLIEIGPRLVSRPGPKRHAATAERWDAIVQQHRDLGSRGVRGQRRDDELVETFGVSERTIAKAVARSRKR